MIGQLFRCESLHDLIVAVKAHRSKTKFFGSGDSVPLHNLAKAPPNRGYRIYEEHAYHMTELTCNLNDTANINLGTTVYIFDPTTIELGFAVFYWAEFRKKKGGIKNQTFYDWRLKCQRITILRLCPPTTPR